MEQNYTLGKGLLYLARFLAGTRIIDPNGYRPIGNVPEFNITVESENLDHFSSMGGTREKDRSIVIETTRTSSLTTDNINPDNLSLFFFGEATEVVQAAVTGLTETISRVRRGNSYFLGVTPQNPLGVRGLQVGASAPTVKVGSATAVPIVDYIIDHATGRFEALASSTVITEGSEVVITYALAATRRKRVVSGNQPVEGALRYIANNPQGGGENFDYIAPYVRIAPNGDLAVISEEWATIPLSVEILKMEGREAVYVDGRPFI